MGMFTGMQQQASKYVYERMKKYLKPKDGKIHVIMVDSFSKLYNQTFECEDKYTTQIDELLIKMQDDGYEIVDIKFNSIRNQGF